MSYTVYMIEGRHWVGYRKYRYNISMTLKQMGKFIWWATEVALIIMIALLMFTNIGHR